uniref:Cadherin domain-containing protein n=1 Tax=Panagrellus redivivus TaxID=6233 RepID=A0A7E4VYN8_PANRE
MRWLPIFCGFLVIIDGYAKLLEVRTITGEISRDAAPGTQVVFDSPLRARKQNPSQITISIVNDRAADAFGVFPTVLSPGDPFAVILRNVDLIPVMDSNNTFSVPIEAKFFPDEDGEHEKLSLNVELLPGVPEVPRLLRSEQNFKLSQRLTSGIVGKVGIKNLAKTDLDKFKYELFGGFNELFTIETAKDGLFLRTSGCDPETCLELPAEFTLLLRVTPLATFNTANPEPTEIALMHLQIARENVMGPHFVKREYSTSISEGSTHFQEPVHLEAVDPDDVGSIEFRLGDPSDVFALDAVTGVLSVKNASLLNIENIGTTVKLNAEVTDGKNAADTVEIDVRIVEADGVLSGEVEDVENWEFEQPIYAFAVAPRQRNVGRVSLINEAKGNIQIVEGGAGNFDLDSETGELTYLGPIERVAKNYTLKLLATPHPHSNTVALSIAQILVAGIGSHAPAFDTPYIATIVDSDTPIESKVAQLTARDFDKNAALVFAEESVECLDFLGNAIDCDGVFGLHPTGDIVVSKQIPDRLMAVSMNISVTDKTHRLEDKDFAAVVITIRKEKTQPDVDSLFKLESVPEPLVLSDDLPVDTYVHTAILKPLSFENNEILKPKATFSLNNSPRFKIDEKTGMIYIAKSLKDLGEANITLKVEVETTQGTKKLHSVIPIEAIPMDVDAPEAGNVNPDGHLSLFVEENAPPGTEIGQIQVKPSPEGGDIIYQLSGKPGIENVIQLMEDGKILVKGPIDYETTKSINFFVKISNQLVKSSVVTVNVRVVNTNDNSPVFNKTESNDANVLENAPIGTFIASLTATDADGDDLSYSLDIPENSPLTDKITIDKNGQILTSDSLTGLEGTYNLTVNTKDQDHSANKEIQLSVLPTMKCQPMFVDNQAVVFKVSGDVAPGKTVATLAASVEDAAECEPVVYDVRFLGSANRSATSFKLNSASGVITTQSSLQNFTRERLALVISAASGHLFTQKAAEIHVIPSELPEAPIFGMKHARFEVPENNAIGDVVGSVKAASHDGLPVYYRLEDPQDNFAVNEEGEIIAKKVLDREAVQMHRLKLMASTTENFDKKATVITPIVVSLNDVNDNGPRFDSTHSDVVIQATTVPGHILTTVKAVDPDSALNPITYRAHSVAYKHDGKATNIEGMVGVNQTNGQVKLLRNVRELTGGSLEIVIDAVDVQDEVEHIAHTTVSVWIADLDRHIIPILIHRNPVSLGAEQIRQYSSKLQANIPSAKILLQSLQFYSLPTEANIAPIIVRDATLAKFVAVDKTNNTILPWKSIRDAIKDLDIDGLSLVSGAPIAPAPATDLMSAESSIVLLAIVFAVLLSLILIVLGIVLCYYRNKFRTERKHLLDAKIVAASINRPPVRPFSPYLERPPELLWERSTTATTGSSTPERRSSYSVQEMKIAVFS